MTGRVENGILKAYGTQWLTDDYVYLSVSLEAEIKNDKIEGVVVFVDSISRKVG